MEPNSKMTYYKTPDGYVAIDEGTQLNASGKKIPTNILAYGRGPQRPNDAKSVAARVFDMLALLKTSQPVAPVDIPNEWRIALGLVKVATVCQLPAVATPARRVYSPDVSSYTLTFENIMCFLIGVFASVAILRILISN